MKKSAEFGVLVIRMEVRLAAPRKRVWTALVRDIGRWWPKGFWSQASSNRFVLEPRIFGGFVLEDDGKGTLLRFTETVHGCIGKGLEKILRGGWTSVSGKGLQPFVERKR